MGEEAYRFAGLLRTAVIHFGGMAFWWGGPYRFTRVLLMSLDFISACSWLLHDNKSDRSYEQHTKFVVWPMVKIPILVLQSRTILFYILRSMLGGTISFRLGLKPTGQI